MIRIELLEKRSKIINSIRRFFIDNGYVETETPILSPFLIPESAIEVFETTYFTGENEKTPLYLIPSPELWMKRLLAQGSGNIFQITKSFRNMDQQGKYHNPEFTMLEWYTVDHDYMDSIDVTQRLLLSVACSFKGNPILSFGGVDIDLSRPFLRLSMREAFQLYLKADLDILILDERQLNRLLTMQGLFFKEESSWESRFNTLFLASVEPKLPRDRAVILYDYPARIGTLARGGKNQLYSERWELYMGGIEIANCYTEENDPAAVTRFIEEEAKKKGKARVKHRIDYKLAGYMEGLPLCSGVALGVDRLIMLFLDKNSINGVIPFSISDIIGDKIK